MTTAASHNSTEARARGRRRIVWWGAGLALLAFVVYLMATAETGPVDPTEATTPQSHGTIVFNTAIIVFREGLEAILIFAAVTASFLGANKARRRPVVAGAIAAFGAGVATWFIVDAVLSLASPLGPRLEAITGFIAVVVLLVILNWFVHNVYWTGWISKHHSRRRKLLASTGIAATIGLVALGFTSVYREGFEVVLFLQALKVQSGGGVVIEGLLIGLAGTAVVGALTFWLHHKLPYRKMLVLTGVLVGTVLVVMIGGTALTFQSLGWLPQHELPFTTPEWMGSWFEIYPYWETIGAQALAAALVIGSYFLARHIQVTRPQRRGETPAVRAESAPVAGAGSPALTSGA
jgi:high-affinity iron transporter